MNALFGTEFSLPVNFLIAFTVVLVLIGTAAYLVRRFGAGALAATTQRNRQLRLAIVDSADIDTRRKLVIVRRDNVEHLLLIGGPTDVLVESNIVRAAPVLALRDAPSRTAAAEASPVSTPATDAGWPIPIQPATPQPDIAARPSPIARPEPVFRPEAATHTDPVILPEPALRHEPAIGRLPLSASLGGVPSQPPGPQWVPADIIPPRLVAEDPRVAIEPPAVSPAQDLDAVHQIKPATPDAQPPALPPMPRPVPQPLVRPANVRAETASSSEEQNLADMAQRLEAALRRPLATGGPRAPAAPAPQRPAPPRPPAPTATPSAALKTDTPTYENLQREMANLLGRQSGSS